MVTDYDCWREGHERGHHRGIVRVLHQNAENAAKVVQAAVAAMPRERNCACASAQNTPCSPSRKRFRRAKEKLNLLFGKYLGW